MIQGIIYIRICLINNKVYIGQTINEVKRNSSWKYDAKYSGKHSLIDKARKKYGIDNFSYKVLKTIKHNDKNLVCDILNRAEQLYINIYNSYYVNGCGYNMTFGGNHRHDHLSNSHKENISKSLKNKTPKNLQSIQQSEKTKQANRDRGIPVLVTCNNTGKTYQYSSSNQACLALNLDRGTVSKVIKGTQKQTKGFSIKLLD